MVFEGVTVLLLFMAMTRSVFVGKFFMVFMTEDSVTMNIGLLR